MSDLPHTHTDGDELRVDHGHITAYSADTDEQAASMHAPPPATTPWLWPARSSPLETPGTWCCPHMAMGAHLMREQSTEEIDRAWPRLADPGTPAEQCAIRALPLLPTGDDAKDQIPDRTDGLLWPTTERKPK